MIGTKRKVRRKRGDGWKERGRRQREWHHALREKEKHLETRDVSHLSHSHSHTPVEADRLTIPSTEQQEEQQETLTISSKIFSLSLTDSHQARDGDAHHSSRSGVSDSRTLTPKSEEKELPFIPFTDILPAMTASIESSVTFSGSESESTSSHSSSSTEGPRFVSFGRRPSNVKILSLDSTSGSWKMMSCRTAGMRVPSSPPHTLVRGSKLIQRGPTSALRTTGE